MSIRVFFDSTIFDIQIFGGISRYFAELIRYSKKEEGIQPIFKLAISNNEYAKILNFPRIKSNLHTVRIKGFKRLNWKLNSFSNSFFSNYHLRKGDFDIYHPTYYTQKSVLYSKKYKTVLTVYDMIHEKFPELFDRVEDLIEIKRQLIINSTAIIAISENTKKDILSFYPEILPEKITVTHLASSINEYEEKPVAIPFKKHIVFVGNRDGYKNFLPMLKAIVPILNQTSDIGLICVGGGNFKKDELAVFSEENITEKVLQKNLSDGELKWIYQNAAALLFPSEYEGFGIPVIEAFECGCPVILPNLSSFPEIGGNAGLFYAKSDLNQIAVYLFQLLDNDAYKKDIVLKGKNQAKKFSWQKMAKETFEVYKSI